MMHAHEVAVGDGFIASMWRTDWHHTREEPTVDGSLLSVSIVVPGGGTDFIKTMLRSHCALPSYSDGQLDWSQALWVAGVRSSRSKKVTIIDWAMPGCVGATPNSIQHT